MEILQNTSNNNFLLNIETDFRLDLAWEDAMQEFEKETLKSIINPAQNFETVRYVHSGYTSTNSIIQNDIWFYFYFYDNNDPPVHRLNYEYVGLTPEENAKLLRQSYSSFFRLEFYKVPEGELPNSGNRKLVFTKHLPIPLGEKVYYTPIKDYVYVPVFTGSNFRNKENMYLYWFQDNTVLDSTVFSGDTFYMTVRYFNAVDGTTLSFLNNSKGITDDIDEENDTYNKVVINRTDYSYMVYSGNTDYRIGCNTADTPIKFYSNSLAGSSI